jgi:bacterioferritin (cytochrome b1)
MERKNPVVDDLNDLLRSELSAVETYRQALDKNRNQYGEDARFLLLSQMMRDHEQAASQLRELVQRMGGVAANDSGAWGTWSKTVMGAAKLLGDKSALKALKEGEESGIKEYRSALRDRTPPPEIQQVVSTIVTREEEHVRQLDRLIEAA